MYIDTHCHLMFPQFKEDRAMVIGNAKKAGVKKFITPGVDELSSKLALELAVSNPGVMYASIGFHPYEAAHNPSIAILEKLLTTTYNPSASLRAGLPTTTSPLSIPHLHAQVLVLETKEPILKDVYWLNITDRSFPFLAVVAHTNFMDKKHYGNRHLTYVGNYLPDNHPYLSMTKQQLLKKFLPYLKRLSLNPASPAGGSKLKTLNSYLFTAPFAQPVHQLYYSKRAPKIVTGIPNVYLANMDSIYPWDRGTNYAVELGQKAARAIEKE